MTFSFDFNSLGAENREDKAEADFAAGYAAASMLCLTIDKQIREAYPNQTDAFYRGVLDGIRQEV